MTKKGKTAIFAILFRVEANPVKRQELVKFLEWDQKESIEKERGTLRFDFFQDPENEDRFYVYEAYEDAAAFKDIRSTSRSSDGPVINFRDKWDAHSLARGGYRISDSSDQPFRPVFVRFIQPKSFLVSSVARPSR
jgi:quinol monooxygenase YgiN